MSSNDIIWITVDSVRADHTSAGNYSRETTPNIENIARSQLGRSYRNCIAQSLWTAPSSASILTGTYPSTHGVDIGETSVLPLDTPSLPERLSEIGYQTVCLSPNPYVSRFTGLDRGFDNFTLFSPFRKKSLFFEHAVPLAKYGLKINRYGPGFTLEKKRHNWSYVLTEITKNWIRNLATGDRNFFYYLHLQNPHLPYTPPRKWEDHFFDSDMLGLKEARELSLSALGDSERLNSTIANGIDFSEPEWRSIIALYDAEIRFADECVGQIFDVATSILDDVTIFVTADHGDLFGERGLLGHSTVLHDGLIHVPMVTYGLTDINAGVDSLVEHIDFTRTIAEITGCRTENLEGVDLRFEEKEFAMSQYHADESVFSSFKEQNPNFDTTRFISGKCTAIRTNRFKYVMGDYEARFFELPDEETDVSSTYPDAVKNLASRADCVEWRSSDDQIAEFPEAVTDQLRELGYME